MNLFGKIQPPSSVPVAVCRGILRGPAVPSGCVALAYWPWYQPSRTGDRIRPSSRRWSWKSPDWIGKITLRQNSWGQEWIRPNSSVQGSRADDSRSRRRNGAAGLAAWPMASSLP